MPKVSFCVPGIELFQKSGEIQKKIAFYCDWHEAFTETCICSFSFF